MTPRARDPPLTAKRTQMAIDYHQSSRGPVERPHPQESLADILDRVLDKGIVIAGDIQINLLDIELLTIKLRLVVASVDKAKEMGIDWWETDPMLNAGARKLADENHRLRQHVEVLERQLERPAAQGNGGERAVARRATRRSSRRNHDG